MKDSSSDNFRELWFLNARASQNISWATSFDRSRRERGRLTRKMVSGIVLVLLVALSLHAGLQSYSFMAQGQQGDSQHKVIEVVKHIVEGSGITEQNMTAWLKIANTTYNCSLIFVQVGLHNHSKYDKKQNNASKVNIWGVEHKSWGSPHISGARGDEVQLTLGDGHDIYIKPSTLSHELGHVFKLPHSSDPYAIMYPDVSSFNLRSCKRKGTNLTDPEQENVRMGVARFQAKDEGKGQDMYDESDSDIADYMDVEWAEGWAEYEAAAWTLHFTVNVISFLEENYWLGVLIESDNNLFTGEPDEGIDYVLTYNPMDKSVEFLRYDWDWTSLDPTGISYELTYACGDLDGSPTVSGVSFSLPLTLLDRRAGSTISVRATANNVTSSDQTPNAGFLTISGLTEPPPPPPPPPALPEFPLGLTLEILLIPVIVYALWRNEQRRRALPKE